MRIDIPYLILVFVSRLIFALSMFNFSFKRTVKPAYNDHPRDAKFVAVVDRWTLFRDSFIL